MARIELTIYFNALRASKQRTSSEFRITDNLLSPNQECIRRNGLHSINFSSKYLITDGSETTPTLQYYYERVYGYRIAGNFGEVFNLAISVEVAKLKTRQYTVDYIIARAPTALRIQIAKI